MIGAGDRDDSRIGPFQPGHGHQQRRLARARRADQADASPAGSSARYPLRIWTRAAPRTQTTGRRLVSDAPPERPSVAGSCFRFHPIDAVASTVHSEPIGSTTAMRRPSQPIWAACRHGIAVRHAFGRSAARLHQLWAAMMNGSTGPAQAPRELDRALGDSLTAGYNLPGGAAFPVTVLQAAAAREGDFGRDRQCRRLRRHLAPAGWSGSTGRWATARWRDPRARRQRCPARA
jgi:hypothetical protein